MRMLSVLWFVVATTAKNRVKTQVRRLKRPKYLVATIAGLAYFWFFFGRRVFAGGPLEGVADELRPIIVVGGAVLAMPLLLTGWIFGKKRAELTFTEAEIQLLFPGPTSRRSLLLYKIGRSLVLVLLSALVMTLLFGARLTGNAVFFLVGAWLAFSTFSLHETGASLTRARLLLHGRRGAIALAAGVGAAVVAFAVLGYFSLSGLVPDAPPQSVEDVAAIAGRVAQTPLGLLLYPIRAPIAAAMAPDLPSFLAALPASLALIAVHVFWVLRQDVAFEEASVEAAEKRAKLIDARRGRVRQAEVGRPKGSMRLSAVGRPEWALAWKNVVAARRLLGGRVVGLMLPFAVIAVMLTVLNPGGFSARITGVAVAAVAFAGFLVLMGPSALRTDFRMDHPNMDILRTLPLSGLQVVTGQLLGPLAVLTVLQWGAIALALVLSLPIDVAWLPLPLRISAAISAAIVAPPLTASGLVIQNAAMLMFPTWTSPGLEQARGFEGMGQRLLTLAGSLLVLTVGLFPAAAAGGVVLLLLWITVGPIAAPIAAIVAAAVLAAELAAAAVLLGRVFERYDVTAE